MENKWGKYGNYAVHIYKRKFSVTRIDLEGIDWLGGKKVILGQRWLGIDKKVIWDFFLKIIVVYDSYQKSHVHIATSWKHKRQINYLGSEEMHWNWHPSGLVLQCFY